MNQKIAKFLTQQLSDRFSALPSRIFCPEDAGWEYLRWGYAVIVPPFYCIVPLEHRQEDGTFFSSVVISPELDQRDSWGMNNLLFSTPEEAIEDGLAYLLWVVETFEQDQKDFGPAAQAAKAELSFPYELSTIN